MDDADAPIPQQPPSNNQDDSVIQPPAQGTLPTNPSGFTPASQPLFPPSSQPPHPNAHPSGTYPGAGPYSQPQAGMGMYGPPSGQSGQHPPTNYPTGPVPPYTNPPSVPLRGYAAPPTGPRAVPPLGPGNAAPPNSGYGPMGYQPPQPPKKGLKWWQWTLIAVASALVLCCACSAGAAALGGHSTDTTSQQAAGGNSGAATATATLAPVSTPTKTPIPKPQASPTPGNDQTLHIGGTHTADDVAVTLLSATKLQPGPYDSVKSGDIYVVAHVRIVNHSGSDVDYNEFDFHAKSSQGNVTNSTFASSYTGNDELNYGTLVPGGKVEGDVILEVAGSDHNAELTWTPSYFSGAADYRWLLGV